MFTRELFDTFFSHVRVILVIRLLFRSSFCRCCWTPDLSVTWPELRECGFLSRHQPWLCHGERARQRVARCLPRRCSETEPSAVYAARLGDDADFRNFRTYDLNTANAGSFRVISLHVATGPNCPLCAVHPEDSACPLMFWVYSLYIAKVCDTSSHLHVRETSMVRCCLVAHSGDNGCLRIFLKRGRHCAADMGRRGGQWTVQCAARESLVTGLDTSLGDSSNFTASALPAVSGSRAWRRQAQHSG